MNTTLHEYDGDGAQIRFGPASFADGDTLVAVIAHEYAHVLQLRGGSDRSTGTI